MEYQISEGLWLDCIIKQVGHLENIIGDFLDFVQIETGNFTINLSEFDLTSFVQDIQLQLNEIIDTHTILFHSNSECWITGDKKRMGRVIYNLVLNSVKYSHPRTTVMLCVEKRENQAIITVKDEGVGVPEEEIPNLFQPFRRLKCTKDMVEGSGLGLFSVKKIVDFHEGSIEIFSVPYQGTKIEVVLPLTKT